MGPAETAVEQDGGADVTLGLLVPRPFGPGTDAVLDVHAVRGNGNDGGVIKLAISDGPRPATHVPKSPMNMQLLSGAKRPESDDGTDGA